MVPSRGEDIRGWVKPEASTVAAAGLRQLLRGWTQTGPQNIGTNQAHKVTS